MKSKVTDYHHGQLRGSLLKAARDTLEQNGASALSLRDLARRIGVSHAAPYRHFASREDLLAALAEEGFQELAERLRSDPRESGTLKEIGLAYVEFATANPSLYKLMFSPELDRTKPESLAAAARSAFELLQTQTGTSEHDQSGTLAAWSLVHGLSQLLTDRLVSDELLQGEPLSRLVESVLGHLKVSGAEDRSG